MSDRFREQLTDYERGKMLSRADSVGFALNYYPDEKRAYQREWSKTIIGDFATRNQAEIAIAEKLGTRERK